MTAEEISKMTAEQFANATFEKRSEALNYVIWGFKWHDDWIKLHDENNKNYPYHKEKRANYRAQLCSWLNALGIETIAE